MSESIEQLITTENVASTLPAVQTDFDRFDRKLDAVLSTFDVVVSADQVKEARRLAQQANKLANNIESVRKEEARKLKKPIVEWEEEMKARAERARSARKALLDQVDKYEAEVRETVQQLLDQYRADRVAVLGVRAEYLRAEYDDLIKVSSLTEGGKLTKAARDEVHRRVEADKQIQERADRRLLELENRCYRAGLEEPLTAEHVRHVLDAEPEVYDPAVERLIEAEKARQANADARRAERQAEQARSAPAEEPAASSTPEPEAAPETEVSTGKIEVTATFVIDECNASDEQIKAALRDRMASAGFKSLSEIRVRRSLSQAA